MSRRLSDLTAAVRVASEHIRLVSARELAALADADGISGVAVDSANAGGEAASHEDSRREVETHFGSSGRVFRKEEDRI